MLLLHPFIRTLNVILSWALPETHALERVGAHPEDAKPQKLSHPQCYI